MLLFNQHSRKKGGGAPTTVTGYSPTVAEGGLFRP